MKWNLYFGWQSSRSPSFVIDSRWLELDDDVAVDVVQSTVQWQWAEHWLGTDGRQWYNNHYYEISEYIFPSL